MTAFFGRLNKHRLKLKQYGETVSDAYLLRRTSLAMENKDKSLTDAMKAMRKLAGATGVPTTYTHARDNLIDTFQFETPDDAKKEQALTTTGANFAGRKPEPEKRKREDDKDNRNRRRRRNRNLPKGSCKNCPNSTSHYTNECYITIREQKGLPNGWQWCLVHAKGTHYDHKCLRHSPNFPPVPKIIRGAAACIPCQDQDQFTKRVLTMLGIPTKTPQPLPQQRRKNPIKITPPPHRQQNFQTAHNVSTNIAVPGPPVADILSTIMAMDANQRQVLSEGLINAGF